MLPTNFNWTTRNLVKMSLAAGRGGGDEEPNKVTVTVELFVKRKASRYDK